MPHILVRSTLRLAAVLAALGCGWVAIATEQKAYAAVCRNPYVGDNPRSVAHNPPALPCGRIHVPFTVTPIGKTWLVGPTFGMSLACIAAAAFAFLAISPRQGTVRMYRWRRAVY